MARQNTWVEGLRSLGGEHIDYGPIEVLDGEIVPPGALAHAAPVGARVYEATGNEGASLELQYRHAVLAMWRRNWATLRMLARCGGRLALVVEFAQRQRNAPNRAYQHGDIDDVLALWTQALETDGGGPQPRAYRLILDATGRNESPWAHAALREHYVEQVAAADLDAEVVPTLMSWIRDRIEANKPMDGWERALRRAYRRTLARNTMNGAPALLRALCETPQTQPLAVALLANRHDAPTTPEEVLRHAERLDEILGEEAWRRRRAAKSTADLAPKPT